MVTLTEVEDEHFQASQTGPDVDDDDFTDTGTLLLYVISGDRGKGVFADQTLGRF